MKLKNAKRFVKEYYVYELVDPRDGAVFYVGKGCGKRRSAHVREWRNGIVINAKKFSRIGDIHRSGHQVVERIVRGGLTEVAAFRLERETIAAHGISTLSNAVAGGNSEASMANAKARDLLHRVQPFCLWYNREPRKAKETLMYWDIIGGLTEVVRRSEQGQSNAIPEG